MWRYSLNEIGSSIMGILRSADVWCIPKTRRKTPSSKTTIEVMVWWFKIQRKIMRYKYLRGSRYHWLLREWCWTSLAFHHTNDMQNIVVVAKNADEFGLEWWCTYCFCRRRQLKNVSQRNFLLQNNSPHGCISRLQHACVVHEMNDNVIRWSDECDGHDKQILRRTIFQTPRSDWPDWF